MTTDTPSTGSEGVDACSCCANWRASIRMYLRGQYATIHEPLATQLINERLAIFDDVCACRATPGAHP